MESALSSSLLTTATSPTTAPTSSNKSVAAALADSPSSTNAINPTTAAAATSKTHFEKDGNNTAQRLKVLKSVPHLLRNATTGSRPSRKRHLTRPSSPPSPNNSSHGSAIYRQSSSNSSRGWNPWTAFSAASRQALSPSWENQESIISEEQGSNIGENIIITTNAEAVELNYYSAMSSPASSFHQDDSAGPHKDASNQQTRHTVHHPDAHHPLQQGETTFPHPSSVIYASACNPWLSDDDDEDSQHHLPSTDQSPRRPPAPAQPIPTGSTAQANPSQENGPPPPSTNLSPWTVMTARDWEICQQLDQEYELALEEREVAYRARYEAVRQSACFVVVFMVLFLTLGTLFFMRQQPNWTVADSLLFSIYTITTVGYGHLHTPKTTLFQIYTIFYILLGIAALTILVAQVYQCIALEASQAQQAREYHYILSNQPVDALWRSQQQFHRHNPLLNRIIPRGRRRFVVPGGNQTAWADDQSNASSPYPLGADEQHQHAPWRIPWIDQAFALLERIKHFLRENEYGRGISVILPFAGLILVGAVVIGPIEGWSAVESIYFAVVSLTTVGFGDYFPSHTTSIWFCIFWLPFSVGFMSLFLTHVAAFYIRLSDTNVRRIERHLRRRLKRAKERAERDRQAARQRAMRGQQHHELYEPDRPPDEQGDMKTSGSTVESNSRSGSSNRLREATTRWRGFNSVPVGEDQSVGSSSSSSVFPATPASSGRKLLANARPASQRRERILQNSVWGSRPDSVLNSDEPPSTQPSSAASTTNLATMKDVLRTVHLNLEKSVGLPSFTAGSGFRSTGPESEYFSIRSSRTLHEGLGQNALLKPSFALRALVQERFAEIIASELAGYQNNIAIKDDTLSVTISKLKQTADKWLVPRRARKAFRVVAFEALYFVGEHGLITRGADALFELTPVEFHGLFSPLLAALGDAETMESWLSATQILADCDLRRDGGQPAQGPLRGAQSFRRADIERREQALNQPLSARTIV